MSKIDELDPGSAASRASGESGADPNFAARPVREADGMAWTDGRSLVPEGQGYRETELPWDRLPASARGVVSDAVWSLQRHSAGIAIRFRTTSREIGVRWTVVSQERAMDHMPATGVSGVDLYLDTGGGYRYVGTGRPTDWPENTARFPGTPDGRTASYLLNLPLYNGTASLEIGVLPGQPLEPDLTHPATARPPVAFYGTSITHGGCASRPGMAYPAILGRLLGVRTVNLGFSGNAKSEPEMAQILARLDPLVWVLDPLPNMPPDTVPGRLKNLLTALRTARPRTPILLVEHVKPSRLAPGPEWEACNRAARTVVEELTRGGFSGLTVVKWETLLGVDNEATVDGIHPSDLGFARLAEGIAAGLAPLVRADQPRG